MLGIGTLARSDRTNLAACVRVRLEKRHPVSDSKAEKYTLIGGTSPYGIYMALPPPPGYQVRPAPKTTIYENTNLYRTY